MTFTCTITTTAIRWDIQPLDVQIEFNSGDDNTGDKFTVEGFTGIYTQEKTPANSTLNFILDLSLNDTTVTCRDVGISRNDLTCTILVFTRELYRMVLKYHFITFHCV